MIYNFGAKQTFQYFVLWYYLHLLFSVIDSPILVICSIIVSHSCNFCRDQNNVNVVDSFDRDVWRLRQSVSSDRTKWSGSPSSPCCSLECPEILDKDHHGIPDGSSVNTYWTKRSWQGRTFMFALILDF